LKGNKKTQQFNDGKLYAITEIRSNQRTGSSVRDEIFCDTGVRAMTDAFLTGRTEAEAVVVDEFVQKCRTVSFGH
jgi:hypothetical protein